MNIKYSFSNTSCTQNEKNCKTHQYKKDGFYDTGINDLSSNPYASRVWKVFAKSQTFQNFT